MCSRKFLFLNLLIILVGASSLGAAPPEYLLIEEPQEPIETEIGPVSIIFVELNRQGVVLGQALPTDLATDPEQLIIDPLECTVLAVRFAPNRRGEGEYELIDPSDDSKVFMWSWRLGERGHVVAQYSPTDPAFVLDADGRIVDIDCGPDSETLTMYRFASDGSFESIEDGIPKRFNRFFFRPREVLGAGEVVVWYYDSERSQLRNYLYLDGEWLWLNKVDRKARDAVVRDIAANGDLLFHRGIPGGGQEGFVYYAEEGIIEKLPHLGGGTTVPSELDSKGRVIGGSFVNAREYHAFLYNRAEGMRDLHPPGYEFSIALTMTAKGTIVGFLGERPGNADPDTIFRYDEKRGLRIMISAADFKALLPRRAQFLGIAIEGVNDRLEIVGTVDWEDPRNESVNRKTTFYYHPKAGLFDVQDFVDAAGGGYKVADGSEAQLSERGDIMLSVFPKGGALSRQLLLIQTKKAR